MTKALKQFCFITLFFITANLSQAASYDEGIEYLLIKPPVDTSAPGKIEVVEVFWYGCPHCYRFEPDLVKWKKSKPANVEFVRVPAIFPNRPIWENHARAYYTAEVLGVLDKIHQPLFDALHKNKQRVYSQEQLASFFAQYGVSSEDFNNTYKSFAVDVKIRRARELTNRYGIDGVPTLIINGKYRTYSSIANGHQGMLDVTDFLIKKESK